jgi:hypothetical protein
MEENPDRIGARDLLEPGDGVLQKIHQAAEPFPFGRSGIRREQPLLPQARKGLLDEAGGRCLPQMLVAQMVELRPVEDTGRLGDPGQVELPDQVLPREDLVSSGQ